MRDNWHNYDVTLSRVVPEGTGDPFHADVPTVYTTRRVCAPSKARAVEMVLEEARSIWPHPWIVAGVHLCTGLGG